MNSKLFKHIHGFSIVELMIILLIIGVLAALAIPSFIRYLKRSRTVEANMNLRKIFDASVSYYQMEGVDRTGANNVKQFPVSDGPAPSANTCCSQVGERCSPTPSIWQTPTWDALSFSVNDPHYFWYTYDSAGTGSTSKFTARANGNFNCDTVYSTFERIGSIDSQNNVTGGSGIYSANDLE